MMHSKLSSSFANLALFVFVLIEVALALPSSKRASNPVSSKLRSVILPEDNDPPQDASSFLQRGAYFGGARSSLDADGLIQQGMGWGMSFTAIQYDANTVKGADFIPGPPENFVKTWKDGAYAFALTCNKYGQAIADDFNAKCNNCGKTYTTAIIWGTYKGMNFDKDSVLSAGCSALEVTNSDECFANFPSGCSIRAVGQPVDLWNDSITRVVKNAKSRSEIIAGIKKYAQEKHESIAVPSS
ncbi:uncharacterized protein FA14DRAFT_153624 [Meira miltonrushii]|uniref:DUF4189 domain-containing protein n=1 Tax=Meira miltonrushii TaxID=1280837 RepID=A0A316VLA3_9BASI|nr:uncharacterized protein FA14DRAFT_153624 [Meira miltonrushii]PWN38297.1 hypothetical protein FA14DRAFT_153624 [Meira miltonrushii]